MKAKLTLTKPILLVLYGFPGSGKTSFAKQLVEEVQAVHVQADKIAADLFGGQSEAQGHKLAHYLTREFLSNGLSVIYDGPTARIGERRALQKLALETKARNLIVWLQIDPVTAFTRTQSRDRRKTEDKFARTHSRESFDAALATQQNPDREQYAVISGKHSFNTQCAAVIKKLYELGVIHPEQAGTRATVMPGMVNLVPPRMDQGRVDMAKRNIPIR